MQPSGRAFSHLRGNSSNVQPLVSQGSSWLHVGTDQPFKSISIGAAGQVWAIARDGSAFHRGSVSPQNPAGQQEKLWPSGKTQTIISNFYLLNPKTGRTIKCSVVPSAGDCWYHIPSPAKQRLKQVSVGRTSIYSVDENGNTTTIVFIPKHNKHLCFTLIHQDISDRDVSWTGNLWYRQGVGPSYPQGSSWEHISNNVRKVSVGPLDQVHTQWEV